MSSKFAASGKLAYLRSSQLQPGPTSNRTIGKPVLKIAEPSRAQSPLSLNSNASSSRSSNRDGLPYRLGSLENSNLIRSVAISSPHKKMRATQAKQVAHGQLITPGRSVNMPMSGQITNEKVHTQSTPLEQYEQPSLANEAAHVVQASQPRDMLSVHHSNA